MSRIAALVLIALSATGCASAPDASFEDDLAVDVDDPAGKEDGVIRPIGTFAVEQIDEVHEGLLEFTLFSDKTFHLSSRVRARCSLGTSHCPSFDSSIDGTYRYTKSGRNRYIRLSAQSFLQYDRFRYTYHASGGELSVTPIYEGRAGNTYDLVRDEAGGYCGQNADCYLQELEPVLCGYVPSPDQLASAWECVEAQCIPTSCAAR